MTKSNSRVASKAKSGTRADFLHQAEKLEAAAKTMLARHRENDTLPVEPDLAEKANRRIEWLDQDAAQLRQWLTEHPEDRRGHKGTIRKSNRTDPDSAKIGHVQKRDSRLLRCCSCR